MLKPYSFIYINYNYKEKIYNIDNFNFNYLKS